MQTILVGIALFTALLFSVPYHIYLTQLWKSKPEKAWIKARKYVSGFFKAELKISGCEVEVRGFENIPPDQAVLFVGNHRSYFDILITHETVKRPVGFVAKKEMLKIPLLPLYMKDIGCLFLDRKDMRQGMKTINQAAEFIKMGHSMILFPEGTRNQGEQLLPFREGGYKIAEKAKCPIVPFAMTGSDLLLESYGGGIKSGKVIIEFAKPFTPSDLPRDERKEKLANLPTLIQDIKDTHNIKS